MVGVVVFFIACLQISQGFSTIIGQPEDIVETEQNTTTTSTTSTTTPSSTTTITTLRSTSIEPITEEIAETIYPTSPPTEPANWEPAPENTFVVRDGAKICLLAKFHAIFTISYTSHRGNQTPVVVKVPQHSVSQKGQCGSEWQIPILTIFWAEFRYSLYFSKHPYRDKEGEYWGVKTMEFDYDSRLKIFDGAVNADKKTVRSINKKEGLLLEAELDKSYRCPATETIFLYNNKKEKKVAVNLTDVQIQAYNVVDGSFSPARLCEEVSVGSQRVETFRDETAPIAVGSTFAILTLLAVIGFAVYRSVTAKRVDYSTME